jgi:hypothetical protein
VGEQTTQARQSTPVHHSSSPSNQPIILNHTPTFVKQLEETLPQAISNQQQADMLVKQAQRLHCYTGRLPPPQLHGLPDRLRAFCRCSATTSAGCCVSNALQVSTMTVLLLRPDTCCSSSCTCGAHVQGRVVMWGQTLWWYAVRSKVVPHMLCMPQLRCTESAGLLCCIRIPPYSIQ